MFLFLFYFLEKHLMPHFQFQSKSMAKTVFPATILHQRQELAQNKTLKEDDRSQAALQKVHICRTRQTHVEPQRTNISQILHLRQCRVKTLVGLGNWTQHKAEVNENHAHCVIASPDLTQQAIFFPVDKKTWGGKHGNADMLWALNAFKQQLFCIIHSYMRDNPSLGKMSQICRSDVNLKNILCYE